MGIFENFAKYELDENDYIILREIHKHTKEPKKHIVIGFRVLPNGYELDKDSANLVDFIVNNTIYNTQKKALDILKTLQNNTNYFRYIGTLNNGGPSELCLSPVGVLKLYEYEQLDLIHYILKGLYYIYDREPSIRITTIKNRPFTIMMDDLYNQLFKEQEIGFEVFRNIFYGLKELGYIEGTGGIETLQGNDLKLTGLGVKYIETVLNIPTEKTSEKENEESKKEETDKVETVENIEQSETKTEKEE